MSIISPLGDGEAECSGGRSFRAVAKLPHTEGHKGREDKALGQELTEETEVNPTDSCRPAVSLSRLLPRRIFDRGDRLPFASSGRRVNSMLVGPASRCR